MKCQCGATAQVYAMDTCAGGWAGVYCLDHVPNGWIISDYLLTEGQVK